MKKNIPVITIDTGVPIPTGRSTFPLDQLDVGNSFTVPLDSARSLRTAISRKQGVEGHEYMTKKELDEHNNPVVRVWRVK